ncbi:general transcription and DNA repair factor IIH helicase subunit XPB1 isoform X1 [Musa acuminata AAA Group]|uniref:general transcription and DNA repair factor IIH helicase subunit XPB1 isoform X1 n=2 Tax=Musa acuminata AAA Group TaxID=214697 RepID=UPI0031DA276C
MTMAVISTRIPNGEREIKKMDFTQMELKSDHVNRPLWACADDRIFLQTFFPLYKQAYDYLVVVTEPVCRHEYNLTPHTLCAAVSVGLKIETIISVPSKLLENEVATWGNWLFVHQSTANYGKVKLVLKKTWNFVEPPFPEVLKQLLKVMSYQRHGLTLRTILMMLIHSQLANLCMKYEVVMRTY